MVLMSIHNNWFNILARGGVFQLLILIRGLFGSLVASSLEGIKIIVLVIILVFMRLSAA